MAKIVAVEFLTLDGVYQAPGSRDEDPSGGFTKGGWQQEHFDELQGQLIMEGMANADAFLLGRRTYDIFAAFWPKQPADDPLAGTMNAKQILQAGFVIVVIREFKNGFLLPC